MTGPSTETRLDLGTLLAGLGALLLLISLFLDWYGPAGGGGVVGINGWESFELLDVLLAWLALAALYAVALSFLPRGRWPAVPMSAVRLAGLAALVLVFVSLINDPPLLRLAPAHELEVGIWLALAGAALMTLGSLLGRVRVTFVTSRDEAQPPPARPYDPDTETRPLP